MYPQPFKRKNRKQYYFNYLDPITKKRVMKSTGLEKKKLAQDMIIEYMNKINGMTSVEAGSLRELLTPWLSDILRHKIFHLPTSFRMLGYSGP
jgi:hypothetical protein